MLRLILLLGVLVAVAVAAAAAAAAASDLPSCTFDDCSVCLPGAKESRENLTIVGASGAPWVSALRIARAAEYWDSQALAAQIVGVVVADKLGINVEYINCEDEATCTFATTNCIGWQDLACGQAYTAAEASAAYGEGLKLFDDELADIMYFTESFSSYLTRDSFAGTDLPYESRQVVVAGNMGYQSRDGLYTFQDLVLSSPGNLAWFPALSEAAVRAPMARPQRLIDDGVSAEEEGCTSSLDFVNSSMIKHLDLGWICVDSWWLNPACAATGDSWRSECVVVVEDDWGYAKQWLYEALASSAVPVAKLMVGYDPWWELVYYRQYDVVFTWWRPDASILPPGPHRMQLEEADDNIPQPALKVAWGPALQADARLRQLLQSALISEKQMQALMQKVAAAYEEGHSAGDSAHGFYQKLACDWLRDNEHVWSAWLMSDRSCEQGQAFDATEERCLPCPAGTYGVKYPNSTAVCVPCAVGTSVSEQGAKECTPCPPGSFQNASGSSQCIPCSRGESQAAQGQAHCERCAPGRVAGGEGSSGCWACAKGSFAKDFGESECQLCPRGTFSDATGAVRCGGCAPGFTTLDLASRASGDCCCKEGTFLPEGGTECLPCGECMTCPTGSKEINIPQGPLDTRDLGPYPAVDPGCMTKLSEPLKPYKCQVEAWCPGGPAGSCSFNHDPESIGCGGCPSGFHKASKGNCEKCTWVAVLAVMGFSGAALLALAAAAIIVDAKAAKTSRNSITCTVVSAMTLHAAQTLGVFGNLAIEWPEPGRSLMAAVSTLAFNIEVLQAECFVGQSKVLGFAARQVMGPMAAAYVALIVFCRRRFITKEGQFFQAMVNGTGSVYQMLFVSILVSVALPFVCFDHPGDAGTSMWTYPEVLCFASQQHAFMIALSAVSLCIGVLPFISVVIYATCFYRGILASSQARAHKHLTMFRFLFFRFKPERFYFGAVLLLRNCLVCLVPTLTWRYPSTQVLLIALVFLVFQGVQLNLQPWRGTLDNVVDGGVSSAMVLLLLCAAMATDFNNTSRTAGLLITVVIIALFAALVIVGARAAYRMAFPPLTWAAFICHHKADAAAQARYLQLRLAKSTGSDIFLDSDHLQHLDDLLDVVRCRIGRLIVYHTAQTMRRPWCAAEITTAFLSNRRCQGVLTPSFRAPTSDEISHSQVLTTFVEAADVNLVERGISAETVAAAFAWHLSPACPKVALEPPAAGTVRFDRLVDTLEPGRGSIACRRLSFLAEGNGPDRFRRGQILVSMDAEDGEACATAGILDMLLNEKVLGLVPEGIYVPCSSIDALPEEYLEQCSAVLVILSRDTMQSAAQRRVLLQLAASPQIEAIPILTPDHRIPDAAWLDGHEDRALAEGVRSFFKRIAITFSTPGALPIMEAQCDAVVARLKHVRGPSMVGMVSPSPRTSPRPSLSAGQQDKPASKPEGRPPARVLALAQRRGEPMPTVFTRALGNLRLLLQGASETTPLADFSGAGPPRGLAARS